jgi:hypothetical protein
MIFFILLVGGKTYIVDNDTFAPLGLMNDCCKGKLKFVYVAKALGSQTRYTRGVLKQPDS